MFQTGIFSVFCYLCRKKVESLDYDLVLDVSVDQSCHEYLTDTGTVILHCEAAGDVSTMKDERYSRGF